MRKVLFVICLFVGFSARAQQVVVGPVYPLTPGKAHTVSLTPAAAPHSVLQPVAPAPVVKPPVGPSDYYQQQFGFFCKREWQFEKQTRFAVKVRLGNYQEAQRIEGK